MPERVQLRRTKGWRKPPNAVVVARPSLWGNPWRVIAAPRPRQPGADWTIDGPGGFFCWTDIRADASRFTVSLYRDWLTNGNFSKALVSRRRDETHDQRRDLDELRRRVLDQLPKLRGHDLACWCAPQMPCHADVLLEIANQEAPN